ncbi:hypothetical protein [Streptomyces sp. TP-A0874]|uniref:hypothetical protein n=1 Tax=Streptomyces sp. TP-A0874 TaxID=549819 RepID=UPI000853CED4|nr:hypothetical protein [Streptomyces sp. TP-A0874]
MSGFLDRAREQAQRGLTQGKQKIDDIQAQRTGADLLRKLGAAYYEEQHGNGSHHDTQHAVSAVENHIAEYGDAFLRG